MYKIGEFSQIVGLTTKTLRYYDKEGILSPSYRNKETGHRFYSELDVEKAELIADMRKFNFTISEMKDALRNIKNRDDFTDYLVEKVSITQGIIDGYAQLISEIKEYLSMYHYSEKKQHMEEYVVFETELPNMKIASIRFKGQYHEIGDYFEKLYGMINNQAVGSPVTCYFSLEYSDQADIEVCVPILERVTAAGIICRNLAGGKALCVKHVGKYEGLKSAYKALFDYAHERHLEYIMPLIEIYRKGYGTSMEGNPDKYITEIYLLLKK